MLLRGPDEERARLDTARQPGGADRERSQRAAVADRHARIRLRGRHHLAPRPPADDHRARRHLRRACTPPTVIAQILPTLDDDPRRAAGRLPARDRRHASRTPARGAELDRRRHAAVPAGGDHAADAAAAQLLAHACMVLLTAPLGLIGVTLFLLVFRVPFGFVAMLGTIALAGHDHAQLGDPGRPDRAGHRRRRTTAGRRSSRPPCAASARSC